MPSNLSALFGSIMSVLSPGQPPPRGQTPCQWPHLWRRDVLTVLENTKIVFGRDLPWTPLGEFTTLPQTHRGPPQCLPFNTFGVSILTPMRRLLGACGVQGCAVTLAHLPRRYPLSATAIQLPCYSVRWMPGWWLASGDQRRLTRSSSALKTCSRRCAIEMAAFTSRHCTVSRMMLEQITLLPTFAVWMRVIVLLLFSSCYVLLTTDSHLTMWVWRGHHI